MKAFKARGLLPCDNHKIYSFVIPLKNGCRKTELIMASSKFEINYMTADSVSQCQACDVCKLIYPVCAIEAFGQMTPS